MINFVTIFSHFFYISLGTDPTPFIFEILRVRLGFEFLLGEDLALVPLPTVPLAKLYGLFFGREPELHVGQGISRRAPPHVGVLPSLPGIELDQPVSSVPATALELLRNY